MATMTDREFQTLKNKIQVAGQYVRRLQDHYQSQTGVRYLPPSPLPAADMVETVEQITEDLAEARGL